MKLSKSRHSWLGENNILELKGKYKTLMRYKALAVRLRQVTETKDPTSTSVLLEKPLENKVESILEGEPIFSHLFGQLEYMLAPETVMLDAPRVKKKKCRSRSGS